MTEPHFEKAPDDGETRRWPEFADSPEARSAFDFSLNSDPGRMPVSRPDDEQHAEHHAGPAPSPARTRPASVPSASQQSKTGPAKQHTPFFSSWWAQVLIASVFVMAGMGLSIYQFEQYGWALFVLLPICLGFIITIIYSRNQRVSLQACLVRSALVSMPVGLLMLLVGAEGMICLIMAAPLALGLIWVGALMGFAVQHFHYLRRSQGALLVLALLASPMTMGFEEVRPRPPAIGSIETAIEIAAPPERVWQALTAFPDLPTPTQAYFKAGIAYPVSAQITRRGVGAQLTWRFTTGDVIERVTTWDPGKLLAFEVVKEPEMMRELSPHDIHPPHLEGFFKTRRGHFKLEALANGRTRLISYTLYTSTMWPAFYWMPQAEWLHGQVQELVMGNVKRLAEGPETLPASTQGDSGNRPTTPLAQPKK